MSNIIQIKRGNGAPGNGALKIGELGLDLNTNTLYVGRATDQSPGAAAVIPFANANIPDASLTTSGIVNISNQTFAGSKKFQATIAIGGYKSSSSDAEYGAIAFRTPSQIDTNNETAMIVVSGGIASDGKNGEPRFQFLEYSKLANGTEGEHSTSAKPFYNFRLPAVPQGLTSSTTYDILTTKDLITIAQGGTGAANAAINTIFAGPSSGSTAAPSFRALVAADIPNLSADKITGGTIDGNIYIGEATDDVNRYVYLRSSLGGIGFYSNGSSNNTKGIWLQAHGTDTSGKAMIYADTNNNITYAAGIMNGTLTMKASQYTDDYTGALNMNNSNIYGVNAIYTSDDAASATEGFNFYRTATTVDTIHAHSGVLYFTPNRTLGTTGTSYKVYHAGNLTYGTGDPSGGTNGDIYIKYTT